MATVGWEPQKDTVGWVSWAWCDDAIQEKVRLGFEDDVSALLEKNIHFEVGLKFPVDDMLGKADCAFLYFDAVSNCLIYQ